MSQTVELATVELATMNLYQPLKVGSDPVAGGDITWACWPTYRRQTLAVGGDHIASFQFSAPDDVLETWLDEYLGCHFEETYGGVVTFTGLIWSMRLAYNGIVLSKTLDDLGNSVRVSYKTGSGAAESVTTAATDTASIDRYGTKEYLEKVTDAYIPSGTATQYAINLLDVKAQIRANKEEVRLGASDGQPGTLQVEVRGYVHTLNYRTLTNASTSTVSADAAITAALSSSEFVSPGTITSNPTVTISEETLNMPVWDRIKAIVGAGGMGKQWLAGCYQSRNLDYKPADETTIIYEQELRAKRRITFTNGDALVPAPFVQPGSVLFVRDLMAGRPVSSDILDDPRALFGILVEYSQAGAVIKGDTSRAANKAAALSMALLSSPSPPASNQLQRSSRPPK